MIEAPIEIRHARAEDAGALVRLSRELGYTVTAQDVLDRLRCLPESDALLVAELRRPPTEATGAPAEPQVAGWIHVTVARTILAEPCAFIYGLVVGEQWRRRGIGRRLLERADEYAAQRGLELVSLRSNVIRREAHAFYAHLGFVESKCQVALTRRVPGAGSDAANRIEER